LVGGARPEFEKETKEEITEGLKTKRKTKTREKKTRGETGIDGAEEPVDCHAHMEQSLWLSRLSWWWAPSAARTETNDRKATVANKKRFFRKNFMCRDAPWWGIIGKPG